MTTFNLGISLEDAINVTDPLKSSIKHTKLFNLGIKNRKAHGSTFKDYQPFDHVQINQGHIFEFGRWQSMPNFPTN